MGLGEGNTHCSTIQKQITFSVYCKKSQCLMGHLILIRLITVIPLLFTLLIDDTCL